jgi:hypothetical protein
MNRKRPPAHDGKIGPLAGLKGVGEMKKAGIREAVLNYI